MDQEAIFAFLRDNLRLEYQEDYCSDHVYCTWTLRLTNPVTGEVVTLSQVGTSQSRES